MSLSRLYLQVLLLFLSLLEPPSAPSLGTAPWYLDSGTSFHMTHYSAHLSTLRSSYRHCTIHTADCSPLFVAG
jgi:hypothetical protein